MNNIIKMFHKRRLAFFLKKFAANMKEIFSTNRRRMRRQLALAMDRSFVSLLGSVYGQNKSGNSFGGKFRENCIRKLNN